MRLFPIMLDWLGRPWYPIRRSHTGGWSRPAVGRGLNGDDWKERASDWSSRFILLSIAASGWRAICDLDLRASVRSSPF